MNEPGVKHDVYLGLGSNLGDRLAFLSEAVSRLSSLPSTEVEETSSIYETEPIGFKDQPDYLNLAVRLITALTPTSLFEQTKRIEQVIGRRPSARFHPREIDIDILLYDQWIFRSQYLFIPHREMTGRKFVLLPLSELAGEVIHPIEKVSVKTLLEKCADSGRVEKTEFELAFQS